MRGFFILRSIPAIIVLISIWTCFIAAYSSIQSKTSAAVGSVVITEGHKQSQSSTPTHRNHNRNRNEKALKSNSRKDDGGVDVSIPRASHRILSPFSLMDEFRSIPRYVKVLTSSSLEGLLLRMTMPSNTFIDPSDLEQLLNVIEKICSQLDLDSKKACQDVRDSEVCYDLIIRKLSGKLRENDWRIGGKSLHIMHELIGNPSISLTHRLRFCVSYLEKYEAVIDNLHNRHSSIPKRNSIPIPTTEGLGLPKAVEGDDMIMKQSNVVVDESSQRWMLLKLYAEYLQNFSEVIRRAGGSYMNDLVVMKGPAPVLDLYSRYFSSALELLEFSKSLPDASRIGSFSNTIANSNMGLVNKDIAYAIAQLQAYSSTTTTSSSYHISSFMEMQHISSEIQKTISDINELVSNDATTTTNTEDIKDAQAPFEVPVWLGDLTTMESYNDNRLQKTTSTIPI